MTRIALHVGPSNGRADRLVVFTANGREFRDKIDTNRSFLRQKTLERAAERFGVPVDELSHLDAEMVKLADEEDARAGRGRRADRAEEFHLTDTGNAERLVARHGENLHFCYPWRKWFVWDCTRWHVDAAGQVDQWAKETAVSMLIDAAAADDDARRQALVKHSRASESANGRANMIRLAQSEPGIPIQPKEFDAKPMLFNCTNGTINLETGKLQPHRREDYITQLCPTAFFPDATAPTWEKFLAGVFENNAELIAFVRRLLGYSLLGVTLEHLLAIWHGRGANGKSTLLNTAKAVIGEDYAMEAATDLLICKRNEHPTERADLYGKRLVTCIESGESRRLAEPLVKQLTGGERVRARRMREDFWEFAPTHTIFLATNHKPVVRGTDWAIWRRIKLIPFTRIFAESEQDKRLPDKLAAEAEGILAWLVRGCREYLERSSLCEPAMVKAATEDYRSGEDLLGEWIRECAVVEPGGSATAADLFDSYRQWTADKSLNQTRFGRALGDRGFLREKVSGRVWWFGIGLTRLESAGWDDQ